MSSKKVVMRNVKDFTKKVVYSHAQLAATYLAVCGNSEPPEWVPCLVEDGVGPVKGLSGAEALRTLNGRLEKGELPISPAFIMERLIRTKTIRVSTTSVVGPAKSGIELNVDMGILKRPDDAFVVLAGVTANLISYETVVMNVNNKPCLGNMRWGNVLSDIKMSPIRTKLFKETADTLIANPVKARTVFFSRMLGSDPKPIDIATLYYAHSLGGSVLPNYVPYESNDQLDLVNGIRAEMGLRPMTKLVRITHGENKLKCTENLDLAYKFFDANIGKRGTEGKRGPLSCGYTLFDMPKVLVKVLSEVWDVLNLVDIFKTRIVMSPTLSLEVCRVLVANEITVILSETDKGPYYEGAPCGIYSMSGDAKDCFVYFNETGGATRPHLANQAWVYKDSALEMIESRLEDFSKYAIVAHLNPMMKNRQLFPTTRPDRMECMIVRDLATQFEGFSLDSMVHRCSLGVSARTNFPRTRCPFWKVDPMSASVKWDREIVYPQLKGEGVDFSNFTTWTKAEPIVTKGLVFEVPVKEFKKPVSEAEPELPKVNSIVAGFRAYLAGLSGNAITEKLGEFTRIYGGLQPRIPGTPASKLFDVVGHLTFVELFKALEGDLVIRGMMVVEKGKFDKLKKSGDREKKKVEAAAQAPPIPEMTPAVLVPPVTPKVDVTPVVDSEKAARMNAMMMKLNAITKF